VRAVAEAHIDEPEVVTKRVTRQTTRSKGKGQSRQASDDDESVFAPVQAVAEAHNEEPEVTKKTTQQSRQASDDDESVSAPVQAVAEAHNEEPEAVTKRVTRQTTRSKGKRQSPQASDDDESVARPIKHPRSAKNARTHESSPAQQPRATKTTSLPPSTHSMARRSQFVDGTFSQINSSLCTAVMHLSSQLL
jgi:hypothetical protein